VVCGGACSQGEWRTVEACGGTDKERRVEAHGKTDRNRVAMRGVSLGCVLDGSL
jgi:hypothetical protein